MMLYLAARKPRAGLARGQKIQYIRRGGKERHIGAVMVVLLLCVCLAALPATGTEIVLPQPLMLAVDDVGWAYDRGIGEQGRSTVLADYEVLKYVAENVGHRVMALFIMCDLDKSSICADYPTTTREGSDWQSSGQDGCDAKMAYVKENAAWIEFGLHGVGHNVFLDGRRYESEFYNADDDYAWPGEQVDGHIECFARLIGQYEIAFPKSFVAPSHAYYYNPLDPEDTGGKLYRKGVRYANNLFWTFRELHPPHEQGGGFDNGVLLLNREGEVVCDPHKPCCTLSEYKAWPAAVQESHWTNWLNSDPSLNKSKPGETFIRWYRGINNAPDRYLPKNTAQCYSQWLYKKYATIAAGDGSAVIDVTGMPAEAYDYDLLQTLVLKVALGGRHVSGAGIDNGACVCGYWEDEFGYGYLLVGHRTNPMGRLERETYTLEYGLGDTKMPAYVEMGSSTFNVLGIEWGDGWVKADIEMYGTQDVVVKTSFAPSSVAVSSTGLAINDWTYDPAEGLATVNVSGANIQGEQGTLALASGPLSAGTAFSPVSRNAVAAHPRTFVGPVGALRADDVRGARVIEIFDMRGARCGSFPVDEHGRVAAARHLRASFQARVIRLR